MGRCLLKEQVLFCLEEGNREGKRKSFLSLMGCSHTSSSYCSRKGEVKNDSYSHASLALAQGRILWRNLKLLNLL